MKLYIKNMVCNRCVMVVREELEKAGLQPRSVILGEAELAGDPSEPQLRMLEERLNVLGFELLEDRKKQQIEKIRLLIINQVQQGEIPEHFSLITYISQNLHRDYSALSRLFSEVEGITIEQFFILQKIEKVKELLLYNELSLSEIAFRLGYSSVAHLSGQFKKITGLTPSSFRQSHPAHRSALDEVHR
ncbi:AraC family transcriptional regulator [Compostibacter hankyongensis]|uniref:HTH araC/xylS-type domain-containing protein n=1 Tax=Compostibacter hankyongensis TaxID=1007089 RepID=A0ABP8G1E6_9BACT